MYIDKCSDSIIFRHFFEQVNINRSCIGKYTTQLH